MSKEILYIDDTDPLGQVEGAYSIEEVNVFTGKPVEQTDGFSFRLFCGGTLILMILGVVSLITLASSC